MGLEALPLSSRHAHGGVPWLAVPDVRDWTRTSDAAIIMQIE